MMLSRYHVRNLHNIGPNQSSYEKCVNCNFSCNLNTNKLTKLINFENTDVVKKTRKRLKVNLADGVNKLKDLHFTMFQALDSVFRIAEYGGVGEDPLDGSLCNDCWNIFAPLFHLFLQFVTASKHGSFINNILQQTDALQRNLQEYLVTDDCRSEGSLLAEPNQNLEDFEPLQSQPTLLSGGRKQQLSKINNWDEIEPEGDLKIEPEMVVEVKMEPDDDVLHSDSDTNFDEDPDPMDSTDNNVHTPITETTVTDTDEKTAGRKSLRVRKTIPSYKASSTSAMWQNLKLNNSKTYNCQKCCETFANSDFLKRHIEVHVDGQKHFCSICKCGFSTAKRIQTHMFKAHPSAEIPGKIGTFSDYNCTSCSNKFLSEPALRQHLVSIHLTCPVCKQEFSTKQEINTHVDTHGADWLKPPLTCELCNYKTKVTTCFRRHKLLVHSIGDGKFVCSVCGKKFLAQDGFRDHMRSHSDERPFKCDQCTMTYKLSSSLQTHKMLHAGVKFICEICGHASSNAANLRKHIAGVHHGRQITQKRAPPGVVKKKRFRLGQTSELPTSAEHFTPDLLTSNISGLEPDAPNCSNVQQIQLNSV